MRWKRSMLGLALLGTVSVVGLVEATASRFQLIVLADDLTNQVHGSAPDGNGASSDGPSWGGGVESGQQSVPGATSGGASDSGAGSSSGGSDVRGGSSGSGAGSSLGGGSDTGCGSDSSGGNGNGDCNGQGDKSHNGHGNSADRVDSSNPGKSKNGVTDPSCPSPGNCVDDETGGGSSSGKGKGNNRKR